MRDRLKFIASVLSLFPLSRLLGGGSEAWAAGNMDQARQLNKRGEKLLETGQYQEAAIIFKNMRDACQGKAYCTGVASFYQGRAQLEMAEYDKAVEHFKEAEAIFNKLDKGNEKALVMQARARLMAEKSDYSESLELYNEAGGLFLKFRNTGALFDMFNSTGAIHAYKGLYNECLECLGVANRLLPPKADPRQLAVLNNNTGLVHMMKQEFGIAEQSFKKAIEQFNKYGDRKGVATALNNLGFIYECRAEYPRALKAQEKSMEIAKEIKDVRGEAVALNNVGNVRLKTGDYRSARELYQQSLSITENRGMKQFAAETLNNMGLLHTIGGELSRALDIFRKAHRAATQMGAQASQAWALHNMGFVLKDQGNLKDARACADSAAKIGIKTGDRRLEATASQRRGNLREYLGEFEEAYKDYRLAARLQGAVNDLYFRSVTMLDLATELLRKGFAEPALKYCRQALKVRRDIGSPYGEFLCRLALIHIEKNRYVKGGAEKEGADRERQEDLKQAAKAVELASSVIKPEQVADTMLLNYVKGRLLLEEDAQKALAQFDKLKADAKSAQIGRYQYLASLGAGLAQEKLGKTRDAIASFQEAADYVETIRRTLEEKLRESFAEGEQILGIKNKLAQEKITQLSGGRAAS